MAHAAAGGVRGAQSMNSVYFKPMLRKAYHRKVGSPDTVGDHSIKLNGGDEVAKAAAGNGAGAGWWVRDRRTGIYYPKGQEKLIQDIPEGAAGKDYETINWLH